MPPRCEVRWDSHSGRASGETEELSLVYIVAHATDYADARSAVESEAPLAIQTPRGLITKQEIEWNPEEGDLWSFTVHYGPLKPPEIGDFEWSFDTTGGTAKITQSLRTVNRYAPPQETAPNFKGAIGVTSSGVEGCEIPISTHKWTETHYLPVQALTYAYQDLLESCTGKKNASTFRGKPARSVVFRGATGGFRLGEQRAAISFQFEKGTHLIGQQIGDITGVAKEAWDYLWVRYAEVEDPDAKATTQCPTAVYVEEVIETADFAQLGIGTHIPPPPA